MENKELEITTEPYTHEIGVPLPDDDYHALIARDLCPECVASLRREGGCLSCPACGWSAC